MNNEDNQFDKFVEHELLPYKENNKYESDYSKRCRQLSRKVAESSIDDVAKKDNGKVQPGEISSAKSS